MTTTDRSPGSGRKPRGGGSSAAPAPGAAWRRRPGRAARAARGAVASTPTTRPSRCATPTKARCASARASTAAARAMPRIRACWSARRSGQLLLPRRLRAAAPGGGARGRRRRPRDRHPFLDPRGEHRLPPGVERDLTFRAADVLEKLSGRRPVGIRTASWDFSVDTLAIIRELGLLYDSSLMADDDPYELLDQGEPTGIVELPPEWIRDDARLLQLRPLQRAAALYRRPRRWRRSSAPSSTAPGPRAGCSC